MRVLVRLGVVHGDDRSLQVQHPGDIEGGSVTHVVGVRLEGSSQRRNPNALQFSPG